MNETMRNDALNTFYYLNAVSMKKVDGALRCEVTKAQLDRVLAQNSQKIVDL